VELESVIARNDDLPSTPVDREIVFLNTKVGSYVALDDVGRRIWELLERPRQIGDLINALDAEFAGPREVIVADVIGFLEELADDEMVHVVIDPRS
jgi:hypothetical protein